MTDRRPTAFRLDPEPAARHRPERKPRALAADTITVTPDAVDVFDRPDLATETPPPATSPRRRSALGAIFGAALGVLLSLAVGLWTDRLIRDLFGRADWLGWFAVGAAIAAALAFLAILLRELAGLSRLASVERLRGRALDAVTRNDARAARSVSDDLVAFVSAKPETAAGRRSLAALKNDVIDGKDRIRIAEAELFGPLDARAKVLILDAAKRVSVVTAVSPRAVVDLAYVVFEAARLIRRLSELYGGRPGTLGLFRLARGVLAHLAVTGAMAAGDEVVHQLVGQGLAARLSAKLGEGVVNGMMTARIGVAAMDITRPMPFCALKRPGMSDFLAALTRFSKRAEPGTATPEQ